MKRQRISESANDESVNRGRMTTSVRAKKTCLAWLAATLALTFAVISTLAGCSAPPGPAAGSAVQAAPRVLAMETFLADIAQNVAGGRLTVNALIPAGVDPHTFQPTPQDVARIADSQVLIANGAGLEEWLQKVLDNAGGQRLTIEAATGLASRQTDEKPENDHGHAEGDPHFWLDPIHVIKYAENIRDGLSQADPAGQATYARNAEVYAGKLRELDAWIAAQVAQIPAERRLLVTNHESFGYFADRYGFRVVGTVIPGVSTGASPSAQELAQLVDRLKATGAPAIFLELGANPQLANQLAQETGIKVVTGLYTHTVSSTDANAPTYIEMMRYNVQKIVEALR